VFGPRRMKAGVQPLKRNLGPSLRKDCAMMRGMLILFDEAMTRDLMTSAGEQTVVANVPARVLATTCNRRPSRS